MSARRRRRQNNGIASIVVIVLIFLVVMSIQIFRLKKKEDGIVKRQIELSEQLEYEKQRSKELEELEKYMQTQEYIEDVAKSKLGLAYDNEIIFKVSH